MEHYWIFSHYINGIPVFDRHTICLIRANERITELKTMYSEAFYNQELPLKFFT